MNLKKYYYQDYYQGQDIDLHYEAMKAGVNKGKFEQANFNLYEFALTKRGGDLCAAKLNLAQAANKSSATDASTGLAWSTAQQWLPLELVTTYPGLLAGIGYRHETKSEGELKLGFFFDHTTGLPIVPGSSIKGALRSVFPQFEWIAGDPLRPKLDGNDDLCNAKAEFIADLLSPKDGPKLSYLDVHRLELAIFEGLDWEKTQIARQNRFTVPQDEAEVQVEYLPMTQRDIFLDAYVSGSFYQEHYILGPDALTPHGDDPLQNPIPLPFLKILPGVKFQFQFLLSALGNVPAQQKQTAFQEILTTIGIGAKTNVGYGQLVTLEEFAKQYPTPLARPFSSRPALEDTPRPARDRRQQDRPQMRERQSPHSNRDQVPTQGTPRPAQEVPPPPPPPPDRGALQQFEKDKEYLGKVYKLDSKKSTIRFIVTGNAEVLKFSDKTNFSRYKEGDSIRIIVTELEPNGQIKSFKIQN